MKLSKTIWTTEYVYSTTWHYKNIDSGMEFEEAPLDPDGNIFCKSVYALTPQGTKLVRIM